MKNLSYCKLGEEECEVCIAYMQHDCDAGLEEELKKGVLNDILVKITSNECQQCDDVVRHMKRVKVSRTQYRKDADSDPERNSFYLSGDMQKVIMLPRLPRLPAESLYIMKPLPHLYHPKRKERNGGRQRNLSNC